MSTKTTTKRTIAVRETDRKLGGFSYLWYESPERVESLISAMYSLQERREAHPERQFDIVLVERTETVQATRYSQATLKRAQKRWEKLKNIPPEKRAKMKRVKV